MRITDALRSSKGRGTFFHLNLVGVNSLRWNLPMGNVFHLVEFEVGRPVAGCAFALSTAVYDSSKELHESA